MARLFVEAIGHHPIVRAEPGNDDGKHDGDAHQKGYAQKSASPRTFRRDSNLLINIAMGLYPARRKRVHGVVLPVGLDGTNARQKQALRDKPVHDAPR